MKKIVIFSILILVFFTACTNSVSETYKDSPEFKEITPVSDEEVKDLDIKRFFLKEGIMKRFDLVNSDGKFGEQEFVVTPDRDGSGTYIVDTYDQEFPIETDERLETTHFYELSNNQLYKDYISSNLGVDNRIDEVLLTNQSSRWMSADKSKEYLITAVNKTVETPVQTFTGCIEVVETLTSYDEATVTVYAPGMGKIYEAIYAEGKLLAETILQGYVTGSDYLEYQENKLKKFNEEIINSNEATIFPPRDNITSETSNLDLNDYAERVNEQSLKNLEYYVLHRPLSRDETDNRVFSFVASTSENILIYVDKKNVYIKQISWESTTPLTEEGLYIIQSLLMGLEESVTLEEVNEFLFNSAPSEREFGEFRAKLNTHETGFEFNAIAK